MRLTIARGDTGGGDRCRRNDERVRREKLELLFQPPFLLFFSLYLSHSLFLSLALLRVNVTHWHAKDAVK